MSKHLKFTLIGDSWAAGARRKSGLVVPLNAAILNLATSEQRCLGCDDMTGPDGLTGALRRITAAGLTEPMGADELRSVRRIFIVCIGNEDAREDPNLEDWITGYVALTRFLLMRGDVLLAAQPAFDREGPDGLHITKEQARWSKRGPAKAREVAWTELSQGLSLPGYGGKRVLSTWDDDGAPDYARADQSHLTAAGARVYAQRLAIAAMETADSAA